MESINYPKAWETLEIKENEWISYAILRKNLKNWENLQKSEVEKEFKNLSEEIKTDLKKHSEEIDKKVQKPILPWDLIIPNDGVLEEKNILVSVSDWEWISHTILRLINDDYTSKKEEIEKIFSSLTGEEKNIFKNKLKDLEKKYPTLKKGDNIEFNLNDFNFLKEIQKSEKQISTPTQTPTPTPTPTKEDLIAKRKEVSEAEKSLEIKKEELTEKQEKVQKLTEKEAELQAKKLNLEAKKSNLEAEKNNNLEVKKLNLDKNWFYILSNGNKYKWGFNKDGKPEWEWTMIFKNWEKYEWDFKDWAFEWRWIIIFKNWDFQDWIFKDDKFFTWIYNINWWFDKYYIEWNIYIVPKKYDEYVESHPELNLPKR